MKTSTPKRDQQLQKQWFLIDAEGKVLGKVAAKVAAILRGKHKATFAPHVDMGDHVIIINVEKIQVTGKKVSDKQYYSHSGYPGALKTIPFGRLMEKKPKMAMEVAVAGMLPRTKLKKSIMSKLHLYVGPEHQHEAQKPQILAF